MPYDQAIFADGEFYHVYNRGVEKRTTYLIDRDYQRFLKTLDHYRFKNPPARFSFKNRPSLINKVKDDQLLVEVISFCLMPNHFHLLLRQVSEGGITIFMSKVLNSYTKYFNIKHKRIGPLFQSSFKAKRVEDNEQLIHLSRYIHLNPLIDYLAKDLASYKYSSCPEFLGRNYGFCLTGPILNQFSSSEDYEKFVLDQEDYGRSIKLLERALAREEIYE